MGVKPGYKLTDVGVIPEDWDVVTVEQAGHVLGGRQRSPNRLGDPCKYLRVANVFDGFIDTNDVLEMPFSVAEKERFLLKDGDILLNEGQSLELVGRSAIYRGIPADCCFQNTLVRFRAGKSTSTAFAQLVFQQFLRTGVFASIALQTTSIAHLGAGRLAKLKMPLPPTTEQEAIAGALNDANAFIESLEQLVAKKRRTKQGAMQKLLTGQKRLPGFTSEWEEKRFGELFTMLRNASNSRSELSDSGEVAYIHYGDIHTHPTAFLDATAVTTFISRDKVATVARLADGDLLMADASEDTTAIGKAVELVGLGGREAVAGLHTMLLRGDKRLLADGFKGYLQFLPKVRAALVRLATGVSVYGITKSGVRAIEVSLPSPEEQSAIAAILSDMDAEIAGLEAKLAKARRVKQGMMQVLLTGRIRLVEPVAASAAPKGHNWAFNEAVVISVLAKGFGSEQFPLGRKRYTKLSYLMHRHHEHLAEGYLKKAAGPYNPATKYKGPEAIAIKNGYVRQHARDKFSGFVAADKVAEADSYFRKWYGDDVLTWLEQFRFKPNDELELLATVDMAMEDLRRAGKSVELSTVKLVIRNHPEWEAKLERDIFSDTNIARAIEQCGELFANRG